ncbi:hypothetical protein ACOMHN_033885 [Nucella lapillus]
MEFTFTKRNKQKLLHEGYAYVIKTVNDVLEGRPSTHSHPPSAARCLALKAVGDIKQRAEQSEEATSSIINNCTAEFPLAAAGSLPKKETLARMIRRKRKAPDSDIISEELKLTTRGEQFLAFQTDDIVILTTPSNLDVLARNAHWFCDGTSDSAPLATQLYTIHDFLAYFESTWLGIVQQGRRRRQKFDVAMWNVYNRVGDNLPRTNNSVEGWHRAFDQRMSVTHPTLGRLVSKLRKEQASTEIMLEQRAMGVRMRKNKQYEVVNTRLQALVARYAQEDVLVFLKAVAHNL